MTIRNNSRVAAAIVVSLGLAVSACSSSTSNNRSLYSVKQPVVERNNYTLDVAASAGGLTVPEQQRVADWFESMKLRYGDRIAVEGLSSDAVHEDVAALAARHGLLLSEGAPVTTGFVNPGMVRVVVTRSRAHVPGCPDWSEHLATNLGNSTSDGFGCAVNSNFAAMVADPQHLLHGAEGTGETTVMSSTKAIQTYRAQEPTGKAGLPEVSSSEGS